MRLFWKDQLPLLLFYLLQMILIPVLYWISGEKRPLSIILYGILLSSVILILYLGYRYVQHRKLYLLLNHSNNIAIDHLTPLGYEPFSEAVNNLLQSLDRQYQENLNGHVRRMDQHIVFINRWVHQMKTPLSVIQITLQDLEDVAATILFWRFQIKVSAFLLRTLNGCLTRISPANAGVNIMSPPAWDFIWLKKFAQD